MIRVIRKSRNITVGILHTSDVKLTKRAIEQY